MSVTCASRGSTSPRHARTQKRASEVSEQNSRTPRTPKFNSLADAVTFGRCSQTPPPATMLPAWRKKSEKPVRGVRNGLKMGFDRRHGRLKPISYACAGKYSDPKRVRCGGNTVRTVWTLLATDASDAKIEVLTRTRALVTPCISRRGGGSGESASEPSEPPPCRIRTREMPSEVSASTAGQRSVFTRLANAVSSLLRSGSFSGAMNV